MKQRRLFVISRFFSDAVSTVEVLRKCKQYYPIDSLKARVRSSLFVYPNHFFPLSAFASTLKMEAACYSETLIMICHSGWRHNVEHSNFIECIILWIFYIFTSMAVIENSARNLIICYTSFHTINFPAFFPIVHAIGWCVEADFQRNLQRIAPTNSQS
jgi:hypothetical protein